MLCTHAEPRRFRDQAEQHIDPNRSVLIQSITCNRLQAHTCTCEFKFQKHVHVNSNSAILLSDRVQNSCTGHFAHGKSIASTPDRL